MNGRDGVLLDSLERSTRLIREGGPRDEETLRSDELLQAATLGALTSIGCAAEHVSADLRASHPEVRWNEYVRLGRELVTRYDAVDLDRVWRVVQHDLPTLEQQIRAILGELG